MLQGIDANVCKSGEAGYKNKTENMSYQLKELAESSENICEVEGLNIYDFREYKVIYHTTKN